MSNPTAKKRIRKSAPTIRERTASAGKPSSAGPLKQLTAKVIAALKLVHIPNNPITPFLATVARGVKKGLSWLVPRYFVNSWREVKAVTWPSRRETWRLTTAVFIFAAVFGIVAAIVDKGLEEIFKKLVLR